MHPADAVRHGYAEFTKQRQRRYSVFIICYRHTDRHLLLLQPFYGPWTLSVTSRVSRYQKGKTRKIKPIWIYCRRDSEWQWHHLGHMQICTLPQTDNHARIPPLSFFTGQMPFLLPKQQRQSTEGTRTPIRLNQTRIWTKLSISIKCLF